MTRNLKALGIALAAMFAMSAVAAASASAVQHHITSDSQSGTTYLTADALNAQNFWATTSEPNGNKISCSEVNLLNTSFEGSETTEVTAEPVYNKEERTCTAFTGGSEAKASIKTNGCHYLFTGETTEDITGNQTATVHITCEGENQIEVRVTSLNLKCLDVPGGQTLHGIKYEEDPDEAGDGLIIDAKIHGIESKTTGACGEGTHNDGLYEGRVTVTGYEDAAHTQRVNLGLNTTP